MHSYLVSALTESIALRVQDALRNPDTTTPYTTLKTRLLKTFTLSDYQRAEKLLDMQGDVTERPTVTMDRMLALLPEDVSAEDPGFLFKTLFLRKLPVEIRAHLVAFKGETMRALAERGDEFWASRTSTSPSINSVHNSSEGEQTWRESHCCQSSLVPPTSCMVNVVKSSEDALCWYHATYAAKATRCRQPCAYKAKGKGRGGRF